MSKIKVLLIDTLTLFLAGGALGIVIRVLTVDRYTRISNAVLNNVMPIVIIALVVWLVGGLIYGARTQAKYREGVQPSLVGETVKDWNTDRRGCLWAVLAGIVILVIVLLTVVLPAVA